MRTEQVIFALSCAFAIATGCSVDGDGQPSGEHVAAAMPMMDGQTGGMMADGMMGGNMEDMRSIRGLLASHESIERRVEDISGGVRTVTTSSDPRVASLIRRHVSQMKARYDEGRAIRSMDPVFRELFRNRSRISLETEDIPGGIRVVHRSDDPELALLIRRHARGFVSEAVEEGMGRAMRPTALPEGYSP